MIYENAQGVEQNYVEAIRWYRMAADQGMHIAQLSLGRMYAGGRGILKTDPEFQKLVQTLKARISQKPRGSDATIKHFVTVLRQFSRMKMAFFALSCCFRRARAVSARGVVGRGGGATSQRGRSPFAEL